MLALLASAVEWDMSRSRTSIHNLTLLRHPADTPTPDLTMEYTSMRNIASTARKPRPRYRH